MQYVYQIIGKNLNTKYYFDALDSEVDAKAIVDSLNKQNNSQNLWFGYITIPVHSYQDDRPLKERYQDSLNKDINSDVNCTTLKYRARDSR